MLLPNKTKFRKQQKNPSRGMAHRGNRVSFGEFGMQAVDKGHLTSRQIEAARRAITRALQRSGKVWIRVFPDKPITKKPLEVRQGKGKGNVEYWVVVVRPGMLLTRKTYHRSCQKKNSWQRPDAHHASHSFSCITSCLGSQQRLPQQLQQPWQLRHFQHVRVLPQLVRRGLLSACLLLWLLLH